MGRYSPQQLIRNIERVLSGEAPLAEGRSNQPPLDNVEIDDRDVVLPDAVDEIRGAVLPEMYAHAPINKVAPGSRLALLKKLALVLFRPISGRQAAFNYQVCRALEHLTQEVVANSYRHARIEGALAKLEAEVRDLHERQQALAESIVFPADDIEALNDRCQVLDHRLTESGATLARAEADLRSLLAQERAYRERHDGALDDLTRNVALVKEELRQNLQDRIGVVEARLRDADARIAYATEFRSQVLELLNTGAGPAPAPASAPAAAAPTPAPAFDELAYHQFQRRFRGDEAQLRQSQRAYVDLLSRHLGERASVRTLDLACGDGILVGLCAEAGWEAHGVDINAAMTRAAGEKGLRVETGDAFAFLAAAEPRSFDVVSALQFVEHLDAGQLTQLVRGVHRVLRPGGLFLIETLNPNTLLAHKWFQFDLTHRHLVFPQVFEMLCETAGLLPVEWQGIHPPAEHERLVPVGDEAANANTERLNAFLFGPQDYYLIARKPG
ncbi:MAG: hypothetical protein PWP23_1629 [Candidatus Sumerlaeota bacterium]|nr:hypothetical protein [Candidatus Sumerlaeota bacterium]